MTTPLCVYFSSVTENTKAFVEKLGFDSARIPLYPREEPLFVDRPYLLFVPTYGSGTPSTAVPKQVIRFLNVESNRKLCLGVIGAGNINFGEKYGAGGFYTAEKLGVPLMYRFEIRGNSLDVERVREGILRVYEQFDKEEGKCHDEVTTNTSD